MTDRPEEQQNDLLKDPAFLRGLTMRRMTRRDLFRSAGVGAGALSLGAILAACGGTSADGGGGGDGGHGRRRRRRRHRLERRAERHA